MTLYNGERQMIYIPRFGVGQVEIHRYTPADMLEVFAPEQLCELNHVGRTTDRGDKGTWIDMIWAALHYEKAEEAALRAVAA